MQTLKLTKKYETYPQYKDSGVEWLGMIPKDWETRKLKILFNFQSGDGFPDKLQGGQIGSIPFLKVSDINGSDKYVSEANNYVDEKTVKEKSWHLIPKNSILMAKIGAALGKNHRKVNTVSVCIDNNVLAVTPNNISIEYSFWIWKMLNLSDFENISSVPSVNLGMLKSHFFPIPEVSKQNRISQYLDEKTLLIDQIIEKKEKQIELLKEKKVADIRCLVTKGLDQNIQLLESGISWIGSIPKNWEMRKLSHLFQNIGSGTTPDDKYLTEEDGGVPWVNTGDLNDRYMFSPKKRVTLEALKNISTLRTYSKESIVIAMYGATIGKLGIPQFDFCTNQACCVLENPRDSVSEMFIYYWLLGNKKYIVELAVGGGQPNINKEIVKSLRISLPPKKNQKEIVSYLDIKIKNFDEAIEKVELSIEKLKEFKISLISNVVTGKIKV